MTTTNDDDGEKVGYGKPPVHTRFKKGESGNPKGRPKGKKNLKTDVRETLAERVEVTVNGRKRKVSTQRAILMRLSDKALKGDDKAIARVFALAMTFNDEELMADAGKELKGDDAAIVERALARKAEEKRAAVEEARRQREIDEAWERSGIDDEPASDDDDEDDAWLQ